MTVPIVWRAIKEDGKVVGAWVHCPDCRAVGRIDADQYHGRVSCICPEDCGWHETVNFEGLTSEQL